MPRLRVPPRPRVPPSLSHEPVADGAEVFGESDGEDDVGDEEEGAAAQAEPEGVLQGERAGLSCAGRAGQGQPQGSGGFGAPQGRESYPGVSDAVAQDDSPIVQGRGERLARSHVLPQLERGAEPRR